MAPKSFLHSLSFVNLGNCSPSNLMLFAAFYWVVRDIRFSNFGKHGFERIPDCINRFIFKNLRGNEIL